MSTETDLLQRYPKLKGQLALDRHEDSLAIQAFGRRIYDGQTLYEYLLEFLLVFVSPKGFDEAEDGTEYKFPDPPEPDTECDPLVYRTTCRMGLKRFIFLERSKQEHKYTIDQEAYDELIEYVKSRIACNHSTMSSDDVMSVIQDLFYGFNAVIRNRAWFAQSLLPVAPELIFCEAIRPKRQAQSAYTRDLAFEDLDGKLFNFTQHNFLARGGEVYFIHVLQGLLDAPGLKDELEDGLRRLVCESFPELGALARWVDKQWRDLKRAEAPITQRMECQWIPWTGYKRRAKLTCEELRNLLKAKLPPLTKIDLLAKLVVLQILRMMHERARVLVTREAQIPCWVVQVNPDPHSAIRRYSVESYLACEEDFVKSLDVQFNLLGRKDEPHERAKLMKEAIRHSSRLFRRLGKELGLVAPPKGANMRFAINEDLVKVLVVSTVNPGDRILLSTLLERLFDHFGMAIGPDQISKSEGLRDLRPEDLDANREDFQEMLKRCGFLRVLSDATSIVENPFGG